MVLTLALNKFNSDLKLSERNTIDLMNRSINEQTIDNDNAMIIRNNIFSK